MSRDEINQSGAYSDADTLRALTRALTTARSLVETGEPSVTPEVVTLLNDAEGLLWPRKSIILLGPTGDISSDDDRKFLTEIVRLYSDLKVDVLPMDAFKAALDCKGLSIALK